jgi:hypothetical protein
VNDSDNINPSIAVDKNGKKFIVFPGRNQIPCYFTIDSSSQASSANSLGGDSESTLKAT